MLQRRIQIKHRNSEELSRLKEMGRSDSGYLPLTLGVLRELYIHFPHLRKNTELLKYGYDLQHYKNKVVRLKTCAKTYDLNERLRPYQRDDATLIKYLLETTDGAGVFNDPRTGKTPTVLTVLDEIRPKWTLIVVPASLVYTWNRQVCSWTSLRCYVYEPEEEKVFHKFGGVMVISKNQVSKLKAFHYDMIVVDEAHFLRNNTQQTKAVHKLKGHKRIAMTGTPAVKHASDIHGIFRFLYPDWFPGYWDFAGRYFINGNNGHAREAFGVKPHRKDELAEITAMVSTARKRSEVMPWIPKKEFGEIVTVMTPKQRKYYDEMKKFFETLEEDTGEELDAQNVIVQLMRLRQLTIDPRLVGFQEVGCKTAALYDYLETRADQEPIIIMSMFTSYLKLLEEELKEKGYRVRTIHGEMTGKQKQESADAFQRGEVDILLCNIISAGVGWTLDRGNTIIFVDNAWNPSDNEQAEDRVCPTTQDNVHRHYIIHLTTAQSFDQYMFKLLRNKKSLTDVINMAGLKTIEM